MQLTIQASVLLKALKASGGAVQKSTIPVLANVLITAGDSGLELRCTNLDIETTARCKADVETPGTTTVSQDILESFIAKLPKDATVVLRQAAGENKLSVSAGKARMAMLSLPAEDFPTFAAETPTWQTELSGKDIALLFGRTYFAASTEEVRYYLNGVYLELWKRGGPSPQLRGIATDGHRLALAHIPAPDSLSEAFGVIVPRKTVSEVIKLCADVEKVAVGISQSKISFDTGAVRLVSKLIDGTFPDYERVIPQNNNTVAIIKRAEFAKAADRVATISTEKGRAIKFTFDTGRVELAVNSVDHGSAVEDMPIEFDAGKIEIGFNSRYVADVLGEFETEKIRINLADAGSPTIIRGEGEDAMLAVLMPMRV